MEGGSTHAIVKEGELQERQERGGSCQRIERRL